MILDHIAYRVKYRIDAIVWLKQLGYKEETTFTVPLGGDDEARCSVLVPDEGPEVFVSEGTPGSIVDRWVDAHGGVGAVHHLAYRVLSVQATMDDLGAKGIKFLSDKPLTCPGLTQVFTEPNPLTGMIYEFIERETRGFCEDNVRELMLSTDL